MRHNYARAYNTEMCWHCGEPESDPIHLLPGEECPDCGNLLETHSEDHPCPAPPYLEPDL